MNQLFDLWIDGKLKDAQEDITTRKQYFGWDHINVPQTREEAIQVYQEPEVVAYVLSEVEDRIHTFRHSTIGGIAWFESLLSDPAQASFARKQIKAYEKMIKELEKIRDYIID